MNPLILEYLRKRNSGIELGPEVGAGMSMYDLNPSEPDDYVSAPQRQDSQAALVPAMGGASLPKSKASFDKSSPDSHPKAIKPPAAQPTPGASDSVSQTAANAAKGVYAALNPIAQTAGKTEEIDSSGNPRKSMVQALPSGPVSTGPIQSTEVREYLLNQLRGGKKPEEVDQAALRDARIADALFGAGAGISNTWLQRSGLPATLKGTTFAKDLQSEVAARNAVSAQEQDKKAQLAERMYGQELTADTQRSRNAFLDENADLDRAERAAKRAQDAANAARTAEEKARLQKEAEDAKKELAKLRASMRGAGAGNNAEAKAAAQAAKDARGMAYGWELEPGAHPSPKQLEDHTERIDAATSMKGITSKIRSILGDSNALQRLSPGTVAAQIRQLTKEATLEGKTIGQLGALSGPDMGIMDAIISDPTSLKSMSSDVMRILDGVDEWVDRRVSSKAKAIGVRPKAAGSAHAASGKITVSNGKETLVIDPADEAEAAHDGYHRVSK